MSNNNLGYKKVAFTSMERELLVTLVAERPIIENKKTNSTNISLKKAAWENLEASFNSQHYVHKRSALQLKRCWENIKSQRKKELSHEAASIIKTGGGPPDEGAGPSNLVDSICPFINLTIPGVKTGGGPPDEGAGPSNLVDSICPFINLTIPGVIDSNTTETEIEVLAEFHNNNDNDETNIPDNIETPTANPIKRKLKIEGSGSNTALPSQEIKRRRINAAPTIKSEMEGRVKRIAGQINQDRELHSLRMERERILIEKESVALEREKEAAAAEQRKEELMIKKMELEIKLIELSIEKFK